MANKAALAAALLLVLVALASATTYTTTVATTTIDDKANRRGQQQQCRQQIQGRQFRSCQRYLSQRGGNQLYGLEEEDEEVVMGNPGQQQSRYLRDCCQQLQSVNEQCRCEAIRHAVRQVQQGGSRQQTGQSEQVYDKARYLPRQCNFRIQQCQFHVVFV